MKLFPETTDVIVGWTIQTIKEEITVCLTSVCWPTVLEEYEMKGTRRYEYTLTISQ